MKNTQKGSALGFVILLVFLVLVGIFSYTYIYKNTPTDVVPVENNATTTPVVTDSTSSLALEAGIKSLDSYYSRSWDKELTFQVKQGQSGIIYEAKFDDADQEDGELWISNLTFGDISGDGQDDMVFIQSNCGASCGNYPSIFIYQQDSKTYKRAEVVFEGYVGAGALQTQTDSITIKNGEILISAKGFEGQSPDKAITQIYVYKDGEVSKK